MKTPHRPKRRAPWKCPPSRADHDTVAKDDAHAEEGGDLDLTPGSLEKNKRPGAHVPAGMGTVPLLTREGEVTIAKRIERGQLVVMKAITRSPIVIKELIAVGMTCGRARGPSRKSSSLTTKNSPKRRSPTKPSRR